MRWLAVALAVVVVIAVLLWISTSKPAQPTLPEIGPGARSGAVSLDLATRD
jgi:hypothetical protein